VAVQPDASGSGLCCGLVPSEADAHVCPRGTESVLPPHDVPTGTADRLEDASEVKLPENLRRRGRPVCHEVSTRRRYGRSEPGHVCLEGAGCCLGRPAIRVRSDAVVAPLALV